MPDTSKPCHNCRRRRLRCDRSWPSCHKCTVSGQECLGYGKVFVWTQAIDGPGNPKPSTSRHSQGGGGESAATGAAAVHSSSSSIWSTLGNEAGQNDNDEASSFHNGGAQGLSLRPGHQGRSHQPPFPVEQLDLCLPTASASNSSDNPTASNLLNSLTSYPSLVSNAAVAAPQNQLVRHDAQHGQMPPPETVLGRLTDPVFQDLDRNSRYYLAHCESPPHPPILFFWCFGCSLFLSA